MCLTLQRKFSSRSFHMHTRHNMDFRFRIPEKRGALILEKKAGVTRFKKLEFRCVKKCSCSFPKMMSDELLKKSEFPIQKFCSSKFRKTWRSGFRKSGVPISEKSWVPNSEKVGVPVSKKKLVWISQKVGVLISE